jgi:hypothetical protein
MTTPEPKPRQSQADDASAPPELAEGAAPKPRRKRKTKAEKEAERIAQMKADAEKPIDPRIWMGFGALLLIVGLCIFIDPVGFEQADATSNPTWIQTILVLLLAFFGKNPVTIALGVVGVLSLVWGIRGWLREKSGANKEKPAS